MVLSGYISDYFSVFLAGVAVSFTPCIYPIIPITATLIAGVNVKGTKLAGFVLSCVYVLGIAVSYSILGVAAVLTGRFFGQFQNSPYAFLFVAAVFVFFSLVMADFVPFPALSLGVRGHMKPRNVLSVFFVGLTSGLIVGPCTAPVLGSLLL